MADRPALRVVDGCGTRGEPLTDTARSTAEENVASARVVRLHVAHGPATTRTLPLDPLREVVLGRAPADGTFSLDDSEVSRAHAKLFFDEGRNGWVLEDLGSRNGTFLGGLRCRRGELANGAVIRLGATVLLFEDLEVPAFARLEPDSPSLPGPSLQLQRVRGDLALVAPESVPVLIRGETGVGKELVAAELHRKSGRTGLFVPLNCAAISPELAESELFGHAAGAFTGAQKKSEGLFLAAHQGTLFLDEIAELPLELQPKLLRALSTQEVRPVGASTPVHVDARIVAATHQDLDAMVARGAFRGDLLARLKGWVIEVPPLRDRKLDVLALARLFLERQRLKSALSADAAEALLLHRWPYNVREIEQVVRTATVRAQGEPIRRGHLPAELVELLADRSFKPAEPAPMPLELKVPRGDVPIREGLETVLAHFGGNIADVAAYFEKDRKQIYRWAEKLGLSLNGFRTG